MSFGWRITHNILQQRPQEHFSRCIPVPDSYSAYLFLRLWQLLTQHPRRVDTRASTQRCQDISGRFVSMHGVLLPLCELYRSTPASNHTRPSPAMYKGNTICKYEGRAARPRPAWCVWVWAGVQEVRLPCGQVLNQGQIPTRRELPPSFLQAVDLDLCAVHVYVACS